MIDFHPRLRHMAEKQTNTGSYCRLGCQHCRTHHIPGTGNKQSISVTSLQADYTLTFQCPKLAFMFPENEPFVGKWQVLDIGLHPQGIAGAPAGRAGTPPHFSTPHIPLPTSDCSIHNRETSGLPATDTLRPHILVPATNEL